MKAGTKEPLSHHVDDGSSDSTLSEPPSDLDLDSEEESPYFSCPNTPSKLPQLKPGKVRTPTKSPYFTPEPGKRIICLPFPPLASTKFGLVQEKLANDPFRLLIATIFLNRTRGEQAIPVFFQLMERYPTIEELAAADPEDITALTHTLGFQNQRARKCVELAKAWVRSPPQKGKRYRKINYPNKGDGRDIKLEEAIDDDDERVGWEVAHLPGVGAYALDSWRIFCRDKLRELATSWNGEGATPDFEPEWRRVTPLDKELRAYLSWSYLKIELIWNQRTGETSRASQRILEIAQEGGIVHDEGEYLVLTSSVGKIPTATVTKGAVELVTRNSLPNERMVSRGSGDERGVGT